MRKAGGSGKGDGGRKGRERKISEDWEERKEEQKREEKRKEQGKILGRRVRETKQNSHQKHTLNKLLFING